jgi:hypothetical protein
MKSKQAVLDIVFASVFSSRITDTFELQTKMVEKVLLRVTEQSNETPKTLRRRSSKFHALLHFWWTREEMDIIFDLIQVLSSGTTILVLVYIYWDSFNWNVTIVSFFAYEFNLICWILASVIYLPKVR